MKILLTADLHGVVPWFRWIADHAHDYDLVCVAGDLLDAFRPSGLAAQALALDEWCRNFPVPLALCSGNHDSNNDGFWSAYQGAVSGESVELLQRLWPAPRWMDGLARPGLVTDGRTQILYTAKGPVVVTTIPFDATGTGAFKGLWRQGAALRLQHRAPWFVLHHDPPAGTAVGGSCGSTPLAWSIRLNRPDFVVSGHLHHQPYHGDFHARLGQTWCFNPGCPPATQIRQATAPNHIIVDLEKGEATWDAALEAGTVRILRTVRPNE